MQILTSTDYAVSPILAPEPEDPSPPAIAAANQKHAARDQRSAVARRRKRIRTQIMKRRRDALKP